MKHVGKMKNNGAKIAIVYRTIPGDPNSALVVGTNGLGESYHDALMSLIQDPAGQTANELADILSVRSFPDGSNMLQFLHTRGHLKKVPTNGVLVTPTPNDSIPLNELNILIAEQKGVTVDELAVTEGSKPNKKKDDVTKTTSSSVSGEDYQQELPVDVKPKDVMIPSDIDTPVTASALRSMADKLFKEAQALRKKAEEMEPSKKKERAPKTAKVSS